MNTRSCKAKGREFQNKIRGLYLEVGKDFGLEEGDVAGRQMGGTGVDIVLSPRAKKLFNHEVECKKHKRVVVPARFAEHYKKYATTESLKLLFHENDRSGALVTMRAQDLMSILRKILCLEETIEIHRGDRL